MGLSKEITEFELQHAAKLHSKHRGELAELVFMRKAATLGFAVAKPWGESERYDFVVRAKKIFWRVQVKSVLRSASARRHYPVHTVNSGQVPYTAEEIDFLVAYIFAEDTWYVFPVSVVANHQRICIRSKSQRSKYEQYREAWDLMRPSCAEPRFPETPMKESAESRVEG